VGEGGLIRQRSPYAAIERNGVVVEYWTTDHGRVYRRQTRAGREPALGRWTVNGGQLAARAEIEQVVAARIEGGWSRRA
jgi:hypothetical protein